MIKARRSYSRRFRRTPLYKQIDNSITAKFEVYGVICPSAVAPNNVVVFKIYYNAASVLHEITEADIYMLVSTPPANSTMISNYSAMSLYSVTIEVFPNKYNGDLPGDNPILFGIFKGTNPNSTSYSGFYTSNSAFPLINAYQKRYFVINSPYFNTQQWNAGVPNYHILLRQYQTLTDGNKFTSQTFKISAYFRLKNAIN